MIEAHQSPTPGWRLRYSFAHSTPAPDMQAHHLTLEWVLPTDYYCLTHVRPRLQQHCFLPTYACLPGGTPLLPTYLHTLPTNQPYLLIIRTALNRSPVPLPAAAILPLTHPGPYLALSLEMGFEIWRHAAPATLCSALRPLAHTVRCSLQYLVPDCTTPIATHATLFSL